MGTGLWRHCSTLDTDLEVWSVKYRCAAYVKVRARLVHRTSPWGYGEATYKIKTEHFKNWRRLDVQD